MKTNCSRSQFIALSFLALAWANPASAAVTITFVEDGADVVATFSGTLNLSGLFVAGPSPASGSFINPGSGAFNLGAVPAISGNSTAHVGPLTAPGAFGTGEATGASFTTGDYFGLAPSALSFSTDRLNGGFTNGDSIAGSATWSGASFDSLGLAVGTYTWSWPGDSITLHVTAVPEPSAYAAIMGGLIFTGAMTRRRRRGWSVSNYPIRKF